MWETREINIEKWKINKNIGGEVSGSFRALQIRQNQSQKRNIGWSKWTSRVS